MKKTTPRSAAKGIYDCEVLSNHNLVGQIFLMRLHCPEIAASCTPGQFVNIKVNTELIPLLRKPFSICRRNAGQGWFEVLWKIVGKGTQIMSRSLPGDIFSVIGPLGLGYRLPETHTRAILVGGGLGVAPLPFLCEELLKREVQVQTFLGAWSKDDLSMLDLFEEWRVPTVVTTEDASFGRQGLVTEPLAERLQELREEARPEVFSCGPHAMLRSVTAICENFGVPAQISIETMMGCGFGICVGCPVRLRTPAPDGQLYKLTCMDGPVFDATEITLND